MRFTSGGKGKGERYIDRWLQEHPQLRLYLNREEYELIKDVADEKGLSMKQVILDAVKKVTRQYRRAKARGFREALDLFIDSPKHFYDKVVRGARMRGLKNFKPCLFTSPCKYCGKPVIFTHGDKDYESKVKPTIHEAFSNWYHIRCKRVEKTSYW